MLHIELKTKFPIIAWDPHCVPKELLANYDAPPPVEFDWGRQEPLMDQYSKTLFRDGVRNSFHIPS
jgi:hypothetical protein